MSQAPIMPLVTDALLGDTLHLSTEEFGAYCLVLFTTWRNNGRALPDDDRILRRICRVSRARWRTLRPALIPFFSTDDGFWHQKRLENEWKRVQYRVQVAHQNGSAGGRPKRLKRAETAKPNGFDLVSPTRANEPDPDSNFKNLESLGPSAREARSAPPAASAASGVTEPLVEQYVTPEEVDTIVAAALSHLNAAKPVRNGAAHKATVVEAKFDTWLNNLAAYVGERFDGDARMQAWEAIETARAAGNRSRMPKPVRSALDDLDKLYRSHQNGDAR